MASVDDFKKLELRIAKIVEVNDHPNADKLYLLKVSLGDRQKQMVAGIKLSYTKEELLGKQVVIIDNLEPATIRGQISEGMILAVKYSSGIAVLRPDREVELGNIVT
jgi:methionyl-tRNA synthetase